MASFVCDQCLFIAFVKHHKHKDTDECSGAIVVAFYDEDCVSQ